MNSMGNPGERSARTQVPGSVNNGKFSLKKKLGSGCFGEVYKGINNELNEEVAIKAEDGSLDHGQLQVEASMLNVLRQPVQPQGFVEYYFFGQEGPWNVLVMELLGKSLEDRMQQRGQLSVRTTVLMAEQVICRIEYLHSKGFVHRDIKPENFMFGLRGKVHHIYLIDFGLSKQYWEKGKHIIMKQSKSLTGTARYASLNAHRGCEHGRRDDLEAIGHMLFYFIRGSLPWSGLDARTKQEKYRKIMEKKEQTPISELRGKFPKAFEEYLVMCRSMVFTDRPNYDTLRGFFAEARKAEGPLQDHQYEWFEKDPPKEQLVPLNEWVSPSQPDDLNKAGGSKGRMCIFCGGSSKTKD